MKEYVTLVIEFEQGEERPKLRDIDIELFTGGKVLVFSSVNLLKALMDNGGCKNGNCED